MTDKPNLVSALCAAQAEMKNVAFDSENPHFKNKFASLASVRDATIPILAKHGIACTQTTKLEPFALVTTLRHVNGDTINSVYPLAVAKPQDMGAQITYARRYSLQAICGVVGELDDDGNAAQTAPKAGDGVRGAVAEPEEPWQGPLGKSALKAASKRIAEDITAASDQESLDIFWNSEKAVLDQMTVDLPEWHDRLVDIKADHEERLAIQNPPVGNILKAG